MYLKSLELAGFKSFAKKNTLEFKSAITSIVGPNGSGKSNIAEGFRFVLGEQSIKSMRGKKGEDLIWNGSKEMGRQNRASAKVVFDNTTRLMDVDYDEVAIERVVHRDGVNEYFINGSQVRLKDIMELLAKAHIGASGHHIISQGEADRILNASIRERREMIEDALGLKLYQYKKRESEKKLEKTEENMKEVELLRREIAPHIKFLKKQVEKMERAVLMREELRVLYQEYFRREEEYLKYNKSRLAELRRIPEEKLKKLHEELERAKAVLETSATKDKKSDEIISLEFKMREVRAEKETGSRALGRLEGTIDYEMRRIKKIRESAHSAPEKTVRLHEVETLGHEIELCIEEVKITDDLEKMRAAFVRVKEIFHSFVVRNQTSVDETALAEVEKEIARMQEEKVVLEKKVAESASHEEKFQAEYRALQNDIEKEKDSSRDAEKAVFRIMAEQNEYHGQLNTLKAEEERLLEQDEVFKREIQEAHHLAGRAILDFQTFIPKTSDGREFSVHEIATEIRSAQDGRRHQIEKLKIRLEDSGAGGADDVMKEFKEVSERDQFLEKELADLKLSSESLMRLIKDLEDRLDIEFKNGVEKINTQFQNYFSLMFGGGEAKLQVVREQKKKKSLTDLEAGEDISLAVAETDDEELPEGIDISVSLPRKKIKGLVMLSGGERALTSIALLFAISQVNPPPFIILDETDAALDEANSKKYGDMVENLSKHSQLILITHNRETMARAGVLYGITMGADGGSRLLSIAFEEAVRVAK